MQEYQFKIRYDRFTAELAVDDRCSLYALAQLIIKSVGFDFDHAFEFCDDLRNPYRSKERYTPISVRRPMTPGVKKTRVSSVFHPKRKMIFDFDYGDDWYFLVTCTGVKTSTAKRSFREVVSTRGKPPVQYVYPEE